MTPTGKLSFYQVQELLRATAAKSLPPSGNKSWLQPADMQQVLTAVARKAHTVYIVSQGRQFHIKYAVHNEVNKIWLSPADGLFAPCGWYTPKDLQRELDQTHVIAAV